MMRIFLLMVSSILSMQVLGQMETSAKDSLIDKSLGMDKPELVKSQKWYDKISIGGYVQVRYNGLVQTNKDLDCEQCDKAWGGTQNLSLRRARIIFQGQLHRQVFFYFQPDFASSLNGSNNIAQIRDAYVDLGIDKNNQFRFRIGQSKVPYSFENLQSSRNRLSLDRNDGTNSSFTNERDLGVHFMWAPVKRRELFKYLVDSGLKGSGDYGMVTFGFVNGQPANTNELNNNKHFVLRAAYPFKIKEQIFEASIGGYTGKYQLMNKQISAGVKHNDDLNYRDERLGVAAVWFPKPFGIQAEYNIGRGPQFNKYTDSIETKSLQGGYILLNYQAKIGSQLLIPFAKYKYYSGGKKFEQDARSYNVNELEIGLEWQPLKYFELVMMYSYSERRYEDFSLRNNFQTGHALRIQAQLNF